jgi:hypothetical protein
MQLIQIGEARQKTVLDMIHEMAEQQFAEIQQLKAAAQSRRRETRAPRKRVRCLSSSHIG